MTNVTVRKHVTYSVEYNGLDLEVPFPFDEYSATFLEIGDTVLLGCISRDDDCRDPFEEFDEGEFYQFNPHYIHHKERPDLVDFKTVVQAHPGRVFFVHSRAGDNGYFVDETPLNVHHTKGEDCRAAEIADVDGYYICPEDATNPAAYAKAVVEEYNTWAQGDCWGVCVWTYKRQQDGTYEFIEDARDECWGYYGEKCAVGEVRELLETYKKEITS